MVDGKEIIPNIENYLWSESSFIVFLFKLGYYDPYDDKITYIGFIKDFAFSIPLVVLIYLSKREMYYIFLFLFFSYIEKRAVIRKSKPKEKKSN